MSNRTNSMLLTGVLLGSLLTAPVFAEGPKFSGFIDTTYSYDFNRPLSRRTALRSFDAVTDSFLLNAIQLNVEGSLREGIGYNGKIAFGTDASVYKSAGTGVDGGLPGAPSTVAYNLEVQEAYLTYTLSQMPLHFKAGKFGTHEGIEVIDSVDNFSISRGLLFGLAEPFTHVGALAGYKFPSILDIEVGVANGWDLHTDNNSGKTFLWKLGFDLGEMVNGSVSGTYGAEQVATTNNIRTSVDTTWWVNPTKKWTIALQGNADVEDKTSVADRNADVLPDGGAGHWYGIGIQPKHQCTEKFSLASRYEWFSDLDGARTGGGITGATTIAQTVSITPEYDVTENLIARFEYRHDWTSRNNGSQAGAAAVFEDSTGGFVRSDNNTIAVEFIYKF